MLFYLKACLFGVVQGLTEFLPVSSSGHLFILHRFIDLPIENEIAYDVFLHLATLLAVVIYLRRDVFDLAKAWFNSILGKSSPLGGLAWLIVLATIPAGFFGFILSDFFSSDKVRSLPVVATMLIVVGILFIVFEKISKKTLDYSGLSWQKSLFIGIAQILALIPGTSRSGITIIAGLGTGLKREEAIRFSFILSIPIILGAAMTKVPDLINAQHGRSEWIFILLSAISAFGAAFFSIKFLLDFSRRHNLNPFAYYRFVLAFALIAFMMFL